MGLNEDLLEAQNLVLRKEDRERLFLEGETEPDAEWEQLLHVLTGKLVSFRKRKDAKTSGPMRRKSVLSALEDLNRTAVRDSGREVLDRMEDLVNREPVIRFVSLLFDDAVRKNASDIHIEAFDRKFVIRIRIDGVLQDYPAPRMEFYNAIVSRIKLLSGLDIAQRRMPQDGRYTLQQNGQDVDFRISTAPTLYGESVVIRILNKNKGLLRIEDLGWDVKRKKDMKDILNLQQGMVVVTGPTGSGKSTTLYAFLQELNGGQDKIITIEDPVEYQIPGINQIQVNPDIDLTFVNGLRSILRQDPDIIMVGEMRDRDTAKIGIQAALTGHLVLSTLHTNDSVSAVSRLLDLGVENSVLAPALKVIIAQRLVRAICPNCKKTYRPDGKLLARYGIRGKKTFTRGAGCAKCAGTGYRGRTALFEVLRITDVVQEAILKGATARDIRSLAEKQGLESLRREGARKIIQNVTTVEELARVVEA